MCFLPFSPLSLVICDIFYRDSTWVLDGHSEGVTGHFWSKHYNVNSWKWPLVDVLGWQYFSDDCVFWVFSLWLWGKELTPILRSLDETSTLSLLLSSLCPRPMQFSTGRSLKVQRCMTVKAVSVIVEEDISPLVWESKQRAHRLWLWVQFRKRIFGPWHSLA